MTPSIATASAEHMHMQEDLTTDTKALPFEYLLVFFFRKSVYQMVNSLTLLHMPSGSTDMTIVNSLLSHTQAELE